MLLPEIEKKTRSIKRHVTHAAEILYQRARARRPLDGVCRGYFLHHPKIGAKDRRAIHSIVFYVFRNARFYHDTFVKHVGTQEMRELLLRHDYCDIFCALACLHIAQKEGAEESTAVLEILTVYLANNPHNEMFNQAAVEISHTRGCQARPLNIPAWVSRMGVSPEIMSSFDAVGTQCVRVNTLKTTPFQLIKEFEKSGVIGAISQEIPTAIRVPAGPLMKLSAFAKGHFEIQDISSQILCQLINPSPDDRGLDVCAGAGGKTLALAALKQNNGEIVASDSDRKRLLRGRDRAVRAGATNITYADQHALSDVQTYAHFDWVLVDAPCSGSGTWHRNPDMRWFSDAQDIDRYQVCQREILAGAALRVRVGGALIYATCSLFPAENDDNIRWFLNNHNNFVCVDVRLRGNLSPETLAYSDTFLRLYPLQHGRDGFFASVMIRI